MSLTLNTLIKNQHIFVNNGCSKDTSLAKDDPLPPLLVLLAFGTLHGQT